jgi:hypothetical protein
MSSKKQTTFAKLNRERAVKEKRERKAEKKAAAAAERARLVEQGLDPWAETAPGIDDEPAVLNQD